MAHLVARRTAVRRRQPEPTGIASITGSMSAAGWLSVAAAAAIVFVDLRPFIETGAIGTGTTLNLWRELAGALADAALMLMPAALLVGFPGIARRNRWLLRGAVLLAGAHFARIVLDVVQSWVLELLAPGSGGFIDPGTLEGIAFALLSLAIGLGSIAGAWAFSDGLADAGARPPRLLLLVVPVVLVGAMLAVYWQALTTGLDFGQVVGWLNAVGFTMSMLLIALYAALSLRLIAGPFRRLVPTSAWVLGALGGAALLAQRILSPIGVWLSTSPEQVALVGQVSLAITVLGYVAWPLIMVAALLGLGRGRRDRRLRSPLMRLYVVNPTD